MCWFGMAHRLDVECERQDSGWRFHDLNTPIAFRHEETLWRSSYSLLRNMGFMIIEKQEGFLFYITKIK